MNPRKTFLSRLALTLILFALTFNVAPARQPARQPAQPIFAEGQAQIVPAFQDPEQWIRHRLWVQTEFDSDMDGKLDRVHVDVTRPRQTESEALKVPVIYESSPYFAGTSGRRSSLWDVKQELGAASPQRTHQPAIEYRPDRATISTSQINQWVPRGFAVVHSEAPGTGLSQGCVNVGGPTELLAPKAVIDWLNGRAKGFTTPNGSDEVVANWSTGKVGMTGTSYNGTLPVAAAATGVEGLEAIIPIAPNTSYYHYYRQNGLVVHPGGWLGEDIDFLWDFINSGDPERRERCARLIRDSEMAAGRDRVTGDYNDYWAARDLLHGMGNVKAATLMAHAFNDWNVKPEHSVRIYEALKARGVPAMAYYHQGGHGGAPPLEMMNKWFTRYLYGIENGVERGPRAWIVREGADRTNPTSYANYPNPAASAVTLRLQAGGASAGGLLPSVRAGQGQEKLVDDVSFSGSALAQAEHSENRLIFATPILVEPVHISGTARVSIRLASSKPAANLSVWLIQLPWTDGPIGTSNLITRGWADPQNHSSIRRGESLTPGQLYTVTFDLQPDDQIVPTGKRIGLMIFSSDRDFTLWPQRGAELTIDLDSTSLQLPVVGGSAAFQRAIREQFASGITAQTQPDFSGRWVIREESAAAAGRGGGGGRGGGRGSPGSGWGPDFTITQDARRLTVEYVFFGRGDMQPPIKFVYALDGAETRNRVMMGRGIEERASKTVWDGNKLVITTVFAVPGPAAGPASGQPAATEMKQVLWLESPTSLVVETTRSGFAGGAPTTTTTNYTKR